MKKNMYKPGNMITIKQEILTCHPRSPLAGRTLKVVEFTDEQKKINAYLAEFGKRDDLIPVDDGDQVWYVEPEFIA